MYNVISLLLHLELLVFKIGGKGEYVYGKEVGMLWFKSH